MTTQFNFQNGDVIRGYDFPGRKDCYIEGVVVDANFEQNYEKFFKIANVKHVSEGREVSGTANLIRHVSDFFDMVEPGQRVVKVA